MLLHNRPEHVEALLGCWRARAVPFNVNYRYTPNEVADLLRGMRARAVIYQRGLGEKIRDLVPDARPVHRGRRRITGRRQFPARSGSKRRSAPGARSSLPAGQLPNVGPDDRYLACTGGTTGRPKGVLWRQGDIFVAAMNGADGMTAADALRERADAGGGVWFPTSPLDARRRAVDRDGRGQPGRRRWCSTTTRSRSTCRRSWRRRHASA